ncbi:hypothetical protein LX36DRAFT_446743 [Colletotrichum falcatum]|nr:hypothetical protein LX36DRAFT_446743 [Colletotrichum falcatum]
MGWVLSTLPPLVRTCVPCFVLFLACLLFLSFCVCVSLPLPLAHFTFFSAHHPVLLACLPTCLPARREGPMACLPHGDRVSPTGIEVDGESGPTKMQQPSRRRDLNRICIWAGYLIY